ncbi:MAG: glycosyl transferase family 11 [Candidatus Parcubacteria bacterium]|nr:glycosyl transferase family 11 [Candidatus Parcubacteria bacterium]
MIITKLRGGLGNQMFQYAFGRTEALRLKTRLILDASWYRKADRSFMLDELTPAYGARISNRLLACAARMLMPRSRYYEGFWEDKAYALSLKKILTEEFALKQPSKRFQELSAAIPRGSIAVHVRRGDYLDTPDKCVLGYAYYDVAVRRIIETKKLADPRIMIFSDDTEWCRQEMKSLGGLPAETFDDQGVSDAEELILMSRYSHNVIANSTFSWWAAFLNPNAGAMVAVPQTWYVNPARNAQTLSALILPEWTVIQ